MDEWKTKTQGVRDVAAILPFAMAALLLPPVVLIFTAPLLLGGVPLIVVYLFGTWAAVILAAFLVARRLARAQKGTADDRQAQGGDRL